MSQPPQNYFTRSSSIVKAILLSALTIATTCATAGNAQTAAQDDAPTFEIYCGKAKDLSSSSILPATVVKVDGATEERVLIIWKSEAFKFTPQKRCEVVSPKFQTALQQGRNYLSAGVDKKSSLGIICATANAEQTCDRDSMLFTLKSYQDAGTTIAGLIDLLANNNSLPGNESTTKRVVDMRDFARARKK
jgi:hypothetical protein